MQEVAKMVKGISRQVVVVKSLDTSLFEQAIFLIRDGAVSRKGVTEEDILREANEAAAACIQPRAGGARALRLWQRALYALGGAGVTALIWLLSVLF